MSNFNLAESIEILECTPHVVAMFLSDLSESWITTNEGPDTWSPYDIVGYFIHGEKTDWMPRLKIILSDQKDKKFEPFDRFAQYENSKYKTLTQLLEEFKSLRAENLRKLKALNLREEQYAMTGIHPSFGEVTMSQLLSTWVVHDLNHISQIVRVMAKRYTMDVGPWIEFLGILRK